MGTEHTKTGTATAWWKVRDPTGTVVAMFLDEEWAHSYVLLVGGAGFRVHLGKASSPADVYAARVIAANRGHYPAGPPHCHCGDTFTDFVALDDHFSQMAGIAER